MIYLVYILSSFPICSLYAYCTQLAPWLLKSRVGTSNHRTQKIHVFWCTPEENQISWEGGGIITLPLPLFQKYHGGALHFFPMHTHLQHLYALNLRIIACVSVIPAQGTSTTELRSRDSDLIHLFSGLWSRNRGIPLQVTN